MNPYFDTYQFSSKLGKGYTSIYELDSYASICIAKHSYISDFEYAVISDDCISIQQYDSIDSEHSYPKGDVYSGMQYIDYTPDNEVYKYVIKKDIPAKLIGVQFMPEYYDMYLKREFGINSIDLKEDLKVFPHGISIPEISSVFNQIRNFKGNKYSTFLFFKSKIDELAAIIIQKADAYMSISKFKYVFKAVIGQSISEYMTQKIMEHACEMLSYSNLYIAEIAHLVGYKNAGSFSSQFKKYMGLLPNDYRLGRIDMHVNPV